MSEEITPFCISREHAETWAPSLGEKVWMRHFRHDHFHAECPIGSDMCKVHYDPIDPHASPLDMIRHFVDSDLGGAITVGAVAAVVAITVYWMIKRNGN